MLKKEAIIKKEKEKVMIQGKEEEKRQQLQMNYIGGDGKSGGKSVGYGSYLGDGGGSGDSDSQK